MNAAADETAEHVVEQHLEGPGKRLKIARQAAGLDVARVAEQLHLKPAQVQDLERDAYGGFAARVFVRGYLRNYARLVNLPVDDVLAAFDAACPGAEDAGRLKRVGSHRPQVNSGHGAVRVVSWAVALALVALFLVWWAGYLQVNGSGTEEPMGDVSAPESVAPPLVTGNAALDLPQAPDERAAPLNESPAPQPAPTADPGESADTQVTAPAAESVSEPEPTVPVVASAEPAPTAPAEVPAALATAAIRPEVVLILDDACWVNVRDSSGDFKLVGELKAGTRRVLGGEPPYQVVLGKAAVARITVDGEPYDLAPHIRGQVARFTLDPGAQ